MSCRRSLHGQVPDHAYLCAARGCKYIGVGNQSLSSGTLTARGRDAIAYVTPRTPANAAASALTSAAPYRGRDIHLSEAELAVPARQAADL